MSSTASYFRAGAAHVKQARREIRNLFKSLLSHLNLDLFSGSPFPDPPFWGDGDSIDRASGAPKAPDPQVLHVPVLAASKGGLRLHGLKLTIIIPIIIIIITITIIIIIIILLLNHNY